MLTHKNKNLKMTKIAFKPQYQKYSIRNLDMTLRRSIRTMNKNTEALAVASTKIRLEENAEKSKYDVLWTVQRDVFA